MNRFDSAINLFAMSEDLLHPSSKKYQRGFLTLPFTEDQFRIFIIGLLGRPQTITKRITGVFELHLKDLQNFHDLIGQRIEQQNNGQLVQLTTQIFFNDKSSVLLSSYEELLSYHEIKPVVSIAVKMSWTWLITFTDKKVPEKQEIELTINTASSQNIVEGDEVPFIPQSGEFRMVIQHTARTWGSDIEALLTHQIESIIQPEKKWKKFLHRHSGKVGLFVGSLFFLGSLTSLIYTTHRFIRIQTATVNEFIGNAGANVSSKIDYLLNFFATDSENNLVIPSMVYLTFSILLSIVFGLWIEVLADNYPKSYLILTHESVKAHHIGKKNNRSKLRWFLISLLLSIATGVAANYVYDWLIRHK